MQVVDIFFRESKVFLNIPKHRSPGRLPEGKGGFPGGLAGRLFHKFNAFWVVPGREEDEGEDEDEEEDEPPSSLLPPCSLPPPSSLPPPTCLQAFPRSLF